MFTSILDSSNLTVSASLLCMLVAIILGFVISQIHNLCGKTSKNFLITLVLLTLIVQVVIIMVNGNLGTSVAILGAFSLIRFRSAPGTSRELLSVFLAMAIGLSTGMGHIYFAITFTLIASLLIIILNKINYGQSKITKNLKIIIPEDLDYQDVFNDIFDKYTDNYTLINVKTINMGSLYELKYDIILKDDVNEKEFIDEIRVRNGNMKIALSHPIEGNEL